MSRQTNIKNYKLDKNILRLLEGVLILGGTFPIRSIISLTMESPETINYIFYILRGVLLGDIVIDALKLSKDIIINNQFGTSPTQEIESDSNNDYDYGFEYQPALDEITREQTIQGVEQLVNNSSHYKARRMPEKVEYDEQHAEEPKVHKMVPIPIIGNES